MAAQPATALGLGSPEGRLNVFIIIILVSVAVEPDSRFPVGVFIVLLDVTRQGLDVVVDQRMGEFARRSINHDVLVDFHVGHGGVLILQAALEAAETSTK